MSINKTWNGVVYSIPNTRSESGWETTLSNYLQALADNAATTTFNKQAVRKATTTPVTVSASTDCTIIVDLTGPGASTVNLPAGADKQIFIIVDGKGDASTNNITIDANGSETIEGSLTKVIRLNRECLVLQYSSSAGDWKVIGGYVPNMVGGPASSTDNAIARFDGTTGKLVQNSDCTISDTGAVTLTASSGQHVFSSTAYPPVSFRRSGGFGAFDLWGDTVGTSDKIIVDNAGGIFRIRNNDATITGFQTNQSGAVTLGPSASTATNCAVNGAASVTHGVVFPASQNAVANANTLDDYEEGTWTVTLSGSPTRNTNYGRYTKIGNMVHAEITVAWGSGGSTGSGNYTLNLPFTPAAGNHRVVGHGHLFRTASGWIAATIEGNAGTTTASLYCNKDTTTIDQYVAATSPYTWDNGDYFIFQISYRVD
jgi:hypothetical protein